MRLALKAAAAVALVVVLAAWVFERFIAPPPGATVAIAAPSAPLAAPAPPVDAPHAAQSPDAEAGAVVAQVKGRVERSIAGGAWAAVRVGEKLQANDAIRTGVNARADLEVDDKSSISVAQSSEVGIREVTKAAHTFKLVRGQVAVDYQPDGTRTLRIEGEGGHAVARTDGAKFQVLSSGGTLAVATETGSVNLDASGKSVAVAPGQQSVARAGSAPSSAKPIPVKLLLKLATRATSGCPTVRGVAEAGTEILVDGRTVPIDSSGAFSIKGPTDGRRRFAVVTRHVSGKQEEKVVVCKPPAKVDMSIRWKKQNQP